MKISKLSQRNFWIAAALLVANLLAWGRALSAAAEVYVVDPIRDPEIEALLNYIYSGKHSGETWEVTLTELEAEQTITWYLKRWPQIPFAHPRIEITPDSIRGEGDVTLSGLQFHVGGEARITLENGLPVVEILDLSLPLPGPIRESIEREIQAQLRRADLLPVRFTSAEWREGEVTVRGVIR